MTRNAAPKGIAGNAVYLAAARGIEDRAADGQPAARPLEVIEVGSVPRAVGGGGELKNAPESGHASFTGSAVEIAAYSLPQPPLRLGLRLRSTLFQTTPA
jgi:hypothetical protein